MADIHHRIQVAASLDRVKELVVGAHGFERWWAEDVTTEADGRVSLGFFNRATTYRLRLLRDDGGNVVWRCESGDESHDTELRFAFVIGREGLISTSCTPIGGAKRRISRRATPPGAS